MRKLDDIPKKNIFEVPDDYFDRLPGMIQARLPARTGQQARRTVFFRFAVPALLLAGIAVFLVLVKPDPAPAPTAEELLAQIDTQDLVSYLEDEQELSTDELLELLELSEQELSGIEDEVYDFQLQDEVLNQLIDGYEFELNDL